MIRVFYDVEEQKWKELLSMNIHNGIFHSLESRNINDFTDVGEYILPGFIDAHVHILEDPYQVVSCDDIQRETFHTLWYRAFNNLNEALSVGVTSIKDLGGRYFTSIDIRDKIAEQEYNLPSFYTSGCYFSRTGGHCENRGAILIDKISEFEKYLHFLRENEIRFVKILNDEQVFSEIELQSMITMAHQYEMLVSVHCFHNDIALSAVKAGVDILEHVADYSDELLEIIKSKDVIVIPTFVSAYDSCTTSCEGLDCDISDSLLKEWYEGECKVIPKLFDRNIRVALGSDGGFLGTPCNSVIREIQLLHKYFNISIERLLHSAFITTPQTIIHNKKIGLIKQGYVADFICYEENPLINLMQLEHPIKVFVKGKEFKINEIEYRKLVKEDAEKMCDYLTNPLFDCCNINDFWSTEELQAWFSNTKDICVGAFIGNEMIGFCLTHFHEEVHKVHLENIFVKRMYRKKGIAHNLFNYVKKTYLQIGEKVRFIGLVNQFNPKALEFLEKEDMTIGDKMIWVQLNI